nr:transposase (putative), gypsy type [Tanacetum cinerariifolium]
MSSGNIYHCGTNYLTKKYVGPTVSLGIVAGEGIPVEYSPANIPQRQVAGETFPQRQVAGETFPQRQVVGESPEMSLGNVGYCTTRNRCNYHLPGVSARITSEYGISEALHPELPSLEDRIVDFPEGKKQPEALLCLVGLSRRYYLGDEVYPTFLHDDDWDMDLFSLIRAPNPTKVKTGSRPCVVHEVPLLTVTANRVIEMEDPAAATDSSGVPSTIERSPLDFANENPSQQSTGSEDQEAAAPEVPSLENVTTTGVAPEAGQAKRAAATDPPVVKERHKRGHDTVDTNAPPKILRRDHAHPRPTESTHRRKSLAAIELGMGSTHPVLASQGAPVDVSDPDALSFADPQSRPSADVTQSSKGAAATGDPKSENTSFTSMVGLSGYVDHIAPPGYFSKLRHLHNDNFLKQYNVNLALQVAMGSQLWLRFEQEAKLLKKSVAQVARRDKRIQARENEIKNLETLVEAVTDMKKAAENRSAELSKELESMRAQFSDLQVSNNCLSQQVSTLQEQVMGEEKLKAAFEEFKQYEDNRVEQHCAKIDARLDALSIDFEKELYSHMLTAIVGRRWVIGHGLRLAVMKCSESTELRQALTDVVSAEIAKARDPMDPWACKEEILLADAIAANVSHAEKKRKCQVVCRTHGVGFAHHVRSDGVLVSVPTVAPQGLAILLEDAATQTEISEEEASPWLLRSSSLPVMHS